MDEVRKAKAKAKERVVNCPRPPLGHAQGRWRRVG
ncbi:hypothetical protein DFAR_110007 [Desulfarculales bacterium]